MDASASPAAAAGPQVGLGSLFLNFLRIGLIGFGGVLPWARRMMVDQQRWLTPAEFNDVLALCQFLPGPNIVNMAVALGTRFQGTMGAVAALGGLLLGPMAIVIGLGGLYARWGGLAIVQDAFVGLASAASGLILATAVRIAAPLRGQPVGLGLAVVAFVAIALLRLPLLPTMLVMAPLGIAVTRTGRA